MHFYEQTENGVEPRHYVPMKTRPDELRPSRMSDYNQAVKQGKIWVPSVTTIQNVLAKPALVSWKIDRHIESAYTLLEDYLKAGSTPDMDTFLAQTKARTQQELDKAPQAGTDVHKLLEDAAHGVAPESEHDALIVANVKNAIKEHTGFDAFDGWTPEYNFSVGQFGGQIDLHRQEWVLDYKSKQTADKFKPGKMAYPEHAQQLAAYRLGVSDTAQCANLFICLETGEVDFHIHTDDQLERGWRVFASALTIWQTLNGVTP